MPRTKLTSKRINIFNMPRTIVAPKSCLKKKKRVHWAKQLTKVILMEKIGNKKVKKRHSKL